MTGSGYSTNSGGRGRQPRGRRRVDPDLVPASAGEDRPKGDVLLRLGGKPISGVDDLHRLLTADLAATDQSIEILRGGRLETKTVRPEADA
jgi:hypothetical protein